MNLNHLQYFVDAVQTSSISLAAKKNLVTQSALSRAIKSLESELEIDLIGHQRNSFQVTEAGLAIYESAIGVLEESRSLQELARNYQEGFRGTLSFGCNQSIASYLVGPMLVQLGEQYPDVQISMRLGNTDTIQSLVDERDVDFGVVLKDGEVEKRYNIVPLFRGEFVLVGCNGERFDPERLIVSRTKKGGMSHKFLSAWKKAYGKEIEPRWVYGSWTVIKDLAIAGVGHAFVPRFVCESDIETGRLHVLRSKVKPIPYTLCMIVNRTRVLPRNAELVRRYFEDSYGS